LHQIFLHQIGSSQHGSATVNLDQYHPEGSFRVVDARRRSYSSSVIWLKFLFFDDPPGDR